jgi:endoglucanase
MAADLQFLRELCLAPGPSGYEQPAQEVVRRRSAAVAEPDTDVLGNVSADVNPSGAPRIVLAAHVDQIGLQLTYIDDDGYVYFDKLGGVDPMLLPGRSLAIHSAAGPVAGVVGKRPTHIIPESERGRAPALNEQWIDIGARSRDEALERVQLGDPITFSPSFIELSPGIVATQALDDRAGVYVAFRALEHYSAAPGAARLTALSTVQEETRFMGAIGQARSLEAECIVVIDGDFTTDQPEVDARKVGGTAKLGAGPIFGHGGASNPRLLALATEVAAAEGIPVQHKAYPGDTQTDMEVLQASRGGVAGLNIGLPARYMHSPHEVANIDDLEAAAVLLAALARRLGEVYEPGYFIPRA